MPCKNEKLITLLTEACQKNGFSLDVYIDNFCIEGESPLGEDLWAEGHCDRDGDPDELREAITKAVRYQVENFDSDLHVIDMIRMVVPLRYNIRDYCDDADEIGKKWSNLLGDLEEIDYDSYI